MDARGERQVVAGVGPGDIEPVGISEHVSGRGWHRWEQDCDHLTGGDAVTGQVEIADARARSHLYRAVDPEDLLDGGGHSSGSLRKQSS